VKDQESWKRGGLNTMKGRFCEGRNRGTPDHPAGPGRRKKGDEHTKEVIGKEKPLGELGEGGIFKPTEPQ